MLSPIDWYDKSLSRDNEHDTMQMDIWRWLQSQPTPNGFTCDLRFEIPIIPLSGIGSDSLEVPAFADLAELFTPVDPLSVELPRYILYVMKPRILTISGIVRQCRALEHAVTQMYRITASPTPNAPPRPPAPPPNLNIFAVVPSGDYRVPDLAEIYPTLVWSAATQELQGDRFVDTQQQGYRP